MMRIIAGKARGKKLLTLAGEDTRPTLERIKQSLFSALQFELEGRRVLDLFAGSGQLGLEALSRGAECCWFNDSSKNAMEIVRKNILACGFEKNVKERPLDNEDPTIMACRLVHELCSLSGYRCDVKMGDDCPQVVGTPVIVQKIIFGPNWKDNDYACHVDLNLMNRFLVSYNATSWAGLLTDTDAKKDYIELLLNQVEKILQDTDSNQ